MVDEDSKKLIDNVTKDEDILNLNVTSKLTYWRLEDLSNTEKTSSRSNTNGRRTLTWMRSIF